MQLELEQHLQQAALDGKSLEAVVSPNPLAFAEAWAREMRPRVFRGGAKVLHGLVYALSVVSTTALVSQLLAHSPAFTFTLFAAYLLTGSGLLALLLQLGGFLAPRVRTRAGREALVLAGVVLAVLVLRLAGLQVNWSMALLSWSWPMTIVLLALAAFLLALDWWRSSHREPPSTASASWPALRTVTTFVASVGALDTMMFFGSVAVLDFCRLALRLV
jgi:cytochrome bd-type quinol oxidase subunit 2